MFSLVEMHEHGLSCWCIEVILQLTVVITIKLPGHFERIYQLSGKLVLKAIYQFYNQFLRHHVFVSHGMVDTKAGLIYHNR